MTSREYSKRLGVISDEQLQAALDTFGLGRLLAAEPAIGGLFGQNIMLCSTEGEFVFRGAPHWDPDGNDDWQFQKEHLVSRLVHEAGTGPPVPWPYLVEENEHIFGWNWAIVPRAPGISMVLESGHRFGERDRTEQASALGQALAALHTVTLPSPAVYDRAARILRPIEEPYGEYVGGIIEGQLSRCLAASAATTQGDAEWVRTVVESSMPAFAVRFTPAVVHLDYSPNNVVFDRNKAGWMVTAVIDWMTAEVGHPEADLCRTIGHYLQRGDGEERAFVTAYRGVHPPLPGHEVRFPVFMLWERLLIWEDGQRNRVWFPPDLSLRDWVTPFLDPALIRSGSPGRSRGG